MTARTLLDQLAARASHAEPPALDDAATRRFVDAALTRAASAQHASTSSRSTTAQYSSPHASPAPRDAEARSDRERRFAPRIPAWTFAVAAAALVVVLAWPLLRARHAPANELARVTLPSGDRLVGDAARFEVASLAPSGRRVRLDDGALVVDAVARGQRFELATPHLVASTTGAVFSVDSDAVRSRVQVYRGDVDVEQAGAHHHIGAGAVWDGQVIIAGSRTTLPPALVGAVDELLASDIPPVADATAAPTPATPANPTTPAPSRVDGVEPTNPTTQAPAPGVVVEPTPANPSAPAPGRVMADEPTPANPTAPSPEGARDAARAITARNQAGAADAKPVEAALSLDELLTRASAELRDKQFDRALATAALAKARGATRGPWRMITADALRGLRRFEEAATAYEQAATELRGVEANTAGYTAAYLRFRELRDPAAALIALDAAHVDEPGSPLEERGLALRIRALLAVDRRADARPFAVRYLTAYPSSELRPLVQSIVDR